MGASMAVIDVTDATFEAEVLERSMEKPVVVDLWASWCGPCKTLGPILEKVVGETDGQVVLAKIDVDANPYSAQTFRVQSIPAVYAVHQRRVVDGFVGALPEPQVRQWLDRIVPVPTEVDQLIAAGDEGSLRRAVDLEPANAAAVTALAALLVAAGTPAGRDEAVRLLARLPETAEVRHLLAEARVGDEVVADDGVDAKLDALLARVKEDDGARQEFVDLLEVLGPDDPRTARYRKALTRALF
ncbi:MAG TPA: tetratricopeptide repeat protein [Acidimicrobiales bacterium]|nr:tetratricopeptide repeat protein [Acidimicrobiales bacterium]